MFHGPLPLLPLQHLVSFSAGNNLLSGLIPAGICQANSLQSIILNYNNLTGSIKETFKGCRNLTKLNLQANNLHGEIPEYLAELPLVKLDLSVNNFTGLLPKKLCESSTIVHLYLSSNQLTNLIPECIGKLSGLKILQIDNNYLEGPIPRSVGALRNLATLSLRGNRLSGNIPLELFNCTNLVTLDLSYNNFTGHIPRAISHLTLLNILVLSHNQLSGVIPAEICVGFSRSSQSDVEFFQYHGLLDLSYNRLTGQIPPTIKGCAIVMDLYLQGNLLSGTIPEGLAELTRLVTMDLSFNELVGHMLPWSAPSVQLQGLILSNNQLNGSIPAEIDRILPKVTMLNLSHNALTGNLPRSLLCNQNLSHLDVSNNNLFGQIPFSCPGGDKGWSSTLISFNASNNHFSGSLDGSISNFTKLTYLDIHNNSLNGSLPSAISSVTSLNYLDLSSNDFSGTIPCSICDIFSLFFVNLSGNQIVGTYSLSDCVAGGSCAANNIDHKAVHPSHKVLIAATICGIAIAVILSVLLVVYLRQRLLKRRSPLALGHASKTNTTDELTLRNELLGKKSQEPPSINLAIFEHSLMKVAADDILKATENFSMLHIIGDGGFGTVYRAALPGGPQVAVKRLHNGHRFQANREFHAEMETIGKVKHPNLVPLLGYCASGDERFLIYEYMEHGNLETWLRNNRTDAAEALGWPDRLKICLGSAQGLAFLHHGFVPHVIHRDMKSSNILLDRNMEPRVSDFGLARIISACETHVSTNVAGTLGYVPPEYGLVMKSTVRGDVYSFGVVMLEVLTGRPPTGQEIEEGGGNLVGWVQWMVACRCENELFDPCLPVSGVCRQQMARVLAIAQECTADDPWRRPTMLEVVTGLKATQMMECGPSVVTVSRQDM